MTTFSFNIPGARIGHYGAQPARLLRVEAGLPLTQVAAACGVRHITVSRWLRGESRPNLERAEIVRALLSARLGRQLALTDLFTWAS